MAFGGPHGADPRGGSPEGISPLQSAYVRVSISRVIGSVEVVAGLGSSRVWANVARVIGAVSPIVVLRQEVRISTSPIVGPVRAVIRPTGSIWVDSGLPCIMQDQYEYANEPGLSRTLMQDGDVRQRVRWLGHPRPLSIRVTLDLDQMVDLETLIETVGPSMWNLPLITGDGIMTEHVVRCTGPMAIRAIYDLQFEATIPLEVL